MSFLINHLPLKHFSLPNYFCKTFHNVCQQGKCPPRKSPPNSLQETYQDSAEILKPLCIRDTVHLAQMYFSIILEREYSYFSIVTMIKEIIVLCQVEKLNKN